MTTSPASQPRCDICGHNFPPSELVAGNLVRSNVAALIRHEHPDWSDKSFICFNDLHRYRWDHVEDLLVQDRGELSALERDVIESLQTHEVLSADLNEEFASQLTLGERVADGVAKFGGSWTFIISFGVVLTCWIIVNTVTLLLRQPFDPFPYILLNLVLSCLAAMQAPVIMMSQNRQGSKDRLRSEHDYRINLKAELEIRQLHHKIDHMLNQQWQRLMEIQELQIELMTQMSVRSREESGRE